MAPCCSVLPMYFKKRPMAPSTKKTWLGVSESTTFPYIYIKEMLLKKPLDCYPFRRFI